MNSILFSCSRYYKANCVHALNLSVLSIITNLNVHKWNVILSRGMRERVANQVGRCVSRRIYKMPRITIKFQYIYSTYSQI